MVLILASTKLLTARIAAGCFIAALLIVLFVAKNVGDGHWPLILTLTFLLSCYNVYSEYENLETD